MLMLTRWLTLVLGLGTGLLLFSAEPAKAAGQRFERHFQVTDRPVLTIQNAANGRVEVRSWKNPEVIIAGDQVPDKLDIEMEQAHNRIGLTVSVLSTGGQPKPVEASFQITVPEETELQVHTSNMGLIYIEQVFGDMTLQTVSGDVHLKEVSGYIIIKTTSGSLVCTQCAGKLDFKSVSGNAQILQPALTNADLYTTSGNILYDGDFVRTGIYTMKSGTGLVEVRFSGNDSFDLVAQTPRGTVDNQAEPFLKPDSHGLKHIASKFTKGLFGSVGNGLAKVDLSSFSGTIRIRKRD